MEVSVVIVVKVVARWLLVVLVMLCVAAKLSQ